MPDGYAPYDYVQYVPGISTVATRSGEALCDQVMLHKENGKAHNIRLTETLIRLASATTQETIRSSCRSEGLDWNQYSAHPAGPELMLMMVQGLA